LRFCVESRNIPQVRIFPDVRPIVPLESKGLRPPA
jgi:hypothetical protein